MIKNKNINKGFTLIEIMVSVSIFAIIMVISSGSILTILDANRKSQSLRAIMDNLNFTMEAMTRTIRFGSNYHCDVAKIPPANYPAMNEPLDCGGAGASSIAVLDSTGQQVTYSLFVDGTGHGFIAKSNGVTGDLITGKDVYITKLAFRVYGSNPYVSGSNFPDLFQPQVVIVVSGYVGAKATVQSKFTLETTVSQRAFDFQ
ncbi:MAG: type II secretion system protein [Nitrospira sp.]